MERLNSNGLPRDSQYGTTKLYKYSKVTINTSNILWEISIPKGEKKNIKQILPETFGMKKEMRVVKCK